MANPEGD